MPKSLSNFLLSGLIERKPPRSFIPIFVDFSFLKIDFKSKPTNTSNEYFFRANHKYRIQRTSFIG